MKNRVLKDLLKLNEKYIRMYRCGHIFSAEEKAAIHDLQYCLKVIDSNGVALNSKHQYQYEDGLRFASFIWPCAPIYFVGEK